MGAHEAVRHAQQNRRGRGRSNNNNSSNNNNNNRKHQNPLSRSFESNGPDVKVRGTPAHIAEKYLSLYRDAQSSGDPVLAENYLQHAEHYSRIIMAYREQMQQSGEFVNGAGQRPREGGEGEDVGLDSDEGMEDVPGPHAQGQSPQGQSNFRSQGNFDGQQRNDRPPRQNRDQRFRDRGQERPQGERPERPFSEGGPQASDRQSDQPQADAQNGGGRRPDRFGQGSEQPEFLRRPVRRPRRDDDTDPASGGRSED
jgi:hypothetical protein